MTPSTPPRGLRSAASSAASSATRSMLPSPARSLPSRSLMADCYAREMDDLHRRWLPPEIFADIGIADAAQSSPVDIEGIAVHLAGLLGGGGGKEEAPRLPPPPGGASYHHGAQVCGLEGKVLVACGGGGNGGGAAAARPVLPHSPVQWQVPTNLVNGDGGGVLDPRLAPLRPCHGSSPAKRLGGGTGVFLPRAVVYQRAAATKSPARDGIPPKERLMKQQQQQQRDEAASGMKQQRQNEMVQKQQNAAAAAALHACTELALPQEWTY